MEYPNSPQALLDRLDHLLAEVPASPSCTEDLNDPDCTLQHEQWQKVKIKSVGMDLLGCGIDNRAELTCKGIEIFRHIVHKFSPLVTEIKDN